MVGVFHLAHLRDEVRPVHQVYAASLQYREFLDNGRPVLFAVPPQPGTVISALQLGNRLLVRRTDFVASDEEVPITVDEEVLPVPRKDGQCTLIMLNERNGATGRRD